ncbi:uncharacterized protein [Amphiura filiformis]|uniref:uncharacterized protein n=1 Tax=Amphiura filiformis TaxID=82378 RepID=UPI003B227198
MDPHRRPVNPERRVMLWGLPRSLSTVFLKCISYVPDIQIINEPYNCAATFGPQGFSMPSDLNGVDEFGEFMDDVRKEIAKNPEDYKNGWDDENCTFEWVKRTLEADYPGKKVVFCKDFIFNIMQRLDSIPRGYKHTFLIRDPLKLFLSNRNLSIDSLPTHIADTFQLDEVSSWPMYPKRGYGELLDLIGYLKDRDLVQSSPIIIDADDLQNHPASILSQYCQAVGIPYSDGLLTWEAGDMCVSRNWYISKSYLAANPMIGFYDNAFDSTKFHSTKDLPKSIPDDVVRLARQAKPYYQALYQMRIKPN